MAFDGVIINVPAFEAASMSASTKTSQ